MLPSHLMLHQSSPIEAQRCGYRFCYSTQYQNTRKTFFPPVIATLFAATWWYCFCLWRFNYNSCQRIVSLSYDDKNTWQLVLLLFLEFNNNSRSSPLLFHLFWLKLQILGIAILDSMTDSTIEIAQNFFISAQPGWDQRRFYFNHRTPTEVCEKPHQKRKCWKHSHYAEFLEWKSCSWKFST